MATSLELQYIDESYQKLVQISGSILADGTGSAITNITVTASNATSSSYALSASYAVSASVEIVKEVSSSYADVAGIADAVSGSNVVGYVANATSSITASLAINSDLALTASYAKSVDAIGITGSVENAVYAQNTITTGKNLEATTIAKGTPLYFTGSGTSGNLVGIYRADAGNPNRMPAGGVAGEAIATGAEGVILLDGFINGVDTSLFASGEKVYVGVGGGYTNVPPTGSANKIQYLGNVEKSAVNGSGVIQMMGESRNLPNITTNYVWLGDVNGVPQAVNSASLKVTDAVNADKIDVTSNGANNNFVIPFAQNTNTNQTLFGNTNLTYNPNFANLTTSNITATVGFYGDLFGTASLASNLESTARLNVVDITASNASFSTASIGYLQSITGSAKVIGDAFIILNADSPSLRYAGLSVYDSGSTPISTASFWWDGVTNDWKYNYSSSATHEAAVALFGPEMTDISGAIYPSANTILKGNGNHHVTDSNLFDDGSKIYTNLPISGSDTLTIKKIDVKGDGINLTPDVIISGSLRLGASSNPFITLTGSSDGGRTLINHTSFTIQDKFGGKNIVGGFDYDGYIGTLSGSQYTVLVANHSQWGGGGLLWDGPAISNDIDGNYGAVIGFEQYGAATNTVTFLTNTVHRDNLLLSGSVVSEVLSGSIASNTASLNFDESTFFTVNLVSGSNMHIKPNNVFPGQTVSVKLTQPGTGYGTATFESNCKFAGGTAPTITTGSNAVDIITFITFDSPGEVFATSVQNLS